MINWRILVQVMVVLLGMATCSPMQEELDATDTQRSASIPTNLTTRAPTPTPTSTPPTADPKTTQIIPTLRNAPQGFESFLSPYWVSFHYPDEWFYSKGESIFDLVISSGMEPLRIGLGKEGAALIVKRSSSGIDDPLQALEQFIQTAMNDELNIIEAPKTIMLNGQPAATSLVSYPGRIWPDQMGTHINRVAVVTGPDQSIVFQAISDEQGSAQYG